MAVSFFTLAYILAKNKDRRRLVIACSAVFIAAMAALSLCLALLPWYGWPPDMFRSA